MKAFTCRTCSSRLFFENSVCVACGTALGYARAEQAIVPVDESGTYVDPAGLVWQVCRNLNLSGCTWLAAEPGGQCAACDLTRTRPADDDSEGMAQFPAAEAAKRHLVYEFDRLGIPLDGLVFDMLSSSDRAGADVVIGHADGVITIDLAETDDARRERIRVELGEPYRTLLGHVRHEVGHFVQWRDVQPHPDLLARCREVFGDESADYQAALDHHYAEGPPEEWADSFVTTYATMHPFEDFAESFAHFLHISDTCETAATHGLVTVDPSAFSDFRDLVRGVWVPLSVALNQINRSMGKDDLYPFVLPDPVLDKLAFVAEVAGSHERP